MYELLGATSENDLSLLGSGEMKEPTFPFTSEKNKLKIMILGLRAQHTLTHGFSTTTVAVLSIIYLTEPVCQSNFRFE